MSWLVTTNQGSVRKSKKSCFNHCLGGFGMKKNGNVGAVCVLENPDLKGISNHQVLVLFLPYSANNRK